jgi:hypothetical protein
MKRKSTDQGIGSLELLLDTICNTFGGILLISLLVAVLLNATSRTMQKETAPSASHAALLSVEIEREQLSRQLKSLRDAVKSRNSIVGTLLPRDLLVEANEFNEAQHNLMDLVARKTDEVGIATKAQVKLNELAVEDASLEDKVKQSRSDAAELTKKLLEVVSARSQDISIPRLRQVVTLPRVYFVTDKRLFGPWPERQFGSGNEDEFTESSKGGERVLFPRPGAGIVIPSVGESLAAIEEQLANLDAADEHVKVFVWPDSYGEFELVRRSIVEKGIMLELVPMGRDEMVTIGNAPQAPALVQ